MKEMLLSPEHPCGEGGLVNCVFQSTCEDKSSASPETELFPRRVKPKAPGENRLHLLEPHCSIFVLGSKLSVL